MENETVFAACSGTKPVFAYAVMKLCEKGVMNLETPLTKYTSNRILADPRLALQGEDDSESVGFREAFFASIESR